MPTLRTCNARISSISSLESSWATSQDWCAGSQTLSLHSQSSVSSSSWSVNGTCREQKAQQVDQLQQGTGESKAAVHGFAYRTYLSPLLAAVALDPLLRWGPGLAVRPNHKGQVRVVGMGVGMVDKLSAGKPCRGGDCCWKCLYRCDGLLLLRLLLLLFLRVLGALGPASKGLQSACVLSGNAPGALQGVVFNQMKASSAEKPETHPAASARAVSTPKASSSAAKDIYSLRDVNKTFS